MDIIFTFITLVFSILIIIYCFSLSNANNNYLKFIFSLSIGILYFLYKNSLSLSNIYFTSIPFLLTLGIFLYFLALSNYSLANKILLSMIPEIIISMSLTISRIIQLLLLNSSLNQIIFLISNILLSTTSFIIFINHHKTHNLDFKDNWITVFIEIVISVIVQILLDLSKFQSSINIYLILSVFTTTVFVVLFLKINLDIKEEIEQNAKSEYENMMLKQELSLNQKYLESQEELHILKHDLQHLLTTLSETSNDDLKEKINKTLPIVSNIAIPIETGNTTLNTILNIKRDIAQQKNIEFISTVNISLPLPINDDDLSLILINALDNAIEHMGKEKRIVTIIKSINSSLSISITNSIDSKIELIGDDLKVPKAIDKGYGIRTMQKIVDKYYGSVNYQQTNSEITCSITILGIIHLD